LKEKRGEEEAVPELDVRAGLPFDREQRKGEQEDEEVGGVEAGEAGYPEVAFDQSGGAAGVVVGEDEAGDQEEAADKDEAVVEDGLEPGEVRRGEVEEQDGDGEQRADAGEGGKRRLAGGTGDIQR
jgi:hypothetical protein